MATINKGRSHIHIAVLNKMKNYDTTVRSRFKKDLFAKKSVVATIFLKTRFFLKTGFLKSRTYCIFVGSCRLDRASNVEIT